MPGTLFVVATPIGNLEDVTVRALRVLRQVTLIAAEDTRRTAHLLARHAITTPTTSLHEHNETRKSPPLVARMRAGESIALVSDAGTPTISDPGGRLIRAAIDAGIKVEPIPGPSAVLAALAASGLPTEAFLFLGFPPTRAKARNVWFSRARLVGGTVVFFEAPHRIRRTLKDLAAAFGDCHVVVGRELTKTHEQWVRGPIKTLLEQSIVERGEFTVVINIGCSTELMRPASAPQSTNADLVGEITEINAVSRRHAISEVAKRHGLSPNEVYQKLENVKFRLSDK